jgi:hypothetical protein
MLQFSSSFLRHGDAPAESAARARAWTTLLPELRSAGQRSADLRGLLIGDLPALRYAAGIAR